MIKMSEERSHFKIKKGDVEIEYSGMPKDVDSKYKEAFNWVKSATVTTSAPPKEPSAGPKQSGKAGRGGRRSPVVSRAIDQVISEGFLDKSKTESEVYSELERRAVRGITKLNVSQALERRARSGILDRIKGSGEEYNYTRRTQTET
jgi:hypothetical protein